MVTIYQEFIFLTFENTKVQIIDYFLATNNPVLIEKN